MLLVMLVAISVTLSLIPTVEATSYPKAQNYVADEAGLLSEETIRQIKKINDGLYTDTKTVIAVCTVKNTGEADIAAYSRSLFTEWKLGDGILILISSEDKNYYFVPSVGVEDILTGEVLASVRDEYFESEFNSGNIDRAVQKTVVKLRSVLLDGIKARKTAAADTASADSAGADSSGADAKGTTAGSIIVGILRTILIIAIVAVVLSIVIFAIGLYNEDVGKLLNKYIFSRFNKRVTPEPDYLDERLYGDRRQQVRRQQNGYPHPQNSRNPQYRTQQNYNNGGRYPVHYNNGNAARPYPQQNQRPNNQYGDYGQSGQYNQGSQYTGRIPQNGQYYQNAQGSQYGQYNQYNQYGSGGYQKNRQTQQQNQYTYAGQNRNMRQSRANQQPGYGYEARPQNPQNQIYNNQSGRRANSAGDEDYEATRQFNIPRN